MSLFKISANRQFIKYMEIRKKSIQLIIIFYFFNNAALELLKEAISKAGYSDEIVIGMDVAASEFFREGKYDLDFKSPEDPDRYITPDELADLYRSFVKDYPGILPTLSPFTHRHIGWQTAGRTVLESCQSHN